MDINKALYYFVLGSICGYYLEVIYKTLTEKSSISAGLFNGPYCILYGLGTMFLSILLTNKDYSIITIFLSSFVVLTILEYITFDILEKAYNTKLWDYSDSSMNINGKVCLKFSFYWGVLGAIYVKYIYKILEFVRTSANPVFINTVIYIIFVIIIMDMIATNIMIVNQNMQKKINHS